MILPHLLKRTWEAPVTGGEAWAVDSEKETFTLAVLQLWQILRHLRQALSVSLAILIPDTSSQTSSRITEKPAG